ncbi:MAG: xanthine dehydrogenase [Methylocella sp.]
MHNFPYSGRQRPTTPLAVILGTNEIASAVAVNLYRSGYFVVLSHDPLPPVIRRKMAFHDVLFDDPVTIAGVEAWRADNGLAILSRLGRSRGVIITELGLLDLIVLRTLDILVDARMQKYQVTPDLRRLARFTIGLGPGFTAGTNCEFAIETHPSKSGRILQQGSTDTADRISRRLGGSGAERFVYSAVPGRWHTPLEIGTRIFKDFIVGHLGGDVIRAPFDGILRGVVRDGTEVPDGVKLLEVDPRGRKASWTGIDSRGKTIANAVTKAISIHTEAVTVQSRRALSLVK